VTLPSVREEISSANPRIIGFSWGELWIESTRNARVLDGASLKEPQAFDHTVCPKFLTVATNMPKLGISGEKKNLM
jgi:hypothetical protein